MSKKLVFAAAMTALLVAGCTSNPLSFRKCNMTNAQVIGPTEGTSTGIMLFQFIPIKQNNRFDEAYKDAISKVGATCLNDPVVQEKWFWAYVLNGYSFTVRGTAVKEANQSP
ncbi:hypothetical protein [Geomonas agri]|uniref:hypothetical protein n=1 Tax=Geomonas agri TaxID=2873702 RepID=UPI001CD4F771|nr:hypothetical protein [Geomonas agri]